MTRNSVKGVIECANCRFFSVCAPIRIGDHSYQPIGDAMDKLRRISRGQVLLSEGQQIGSIHTVCKGVSKATMMDAGAEERVVDSYLPGCSIGLESLTGGRSAARVEALNTAAV